MIHIGIAGIGFMGRTHYEAYQRISGAKVVAIYSRSAKRAAGDLSDGWGNIGSASISQLPMDQIQGTTDWRELVSNPNVHIVDVCVPTPLHEQVVIAALKAGKHVVCEKPVTLDTDAALRIERAVNEAKTFFMPAMCLRFWPQWQWLKQAVQSQRYGRVLSATFRRVAGTPPGWYADVNNSGGAILDLHVHDVDFVLHLFGRPRAVTSTGRVDAGAVNHVITNYHYDNVPLVVAESAWFEAGYPFSSRFTVQFETGLADYDTGRADPLVWISQGQSETVTCDMSEGDGWQRQLAYFMQCVKNKRKPEIVTIADALAVMRTIDAERRSVMTNATVAV